MLKTTILFLLLTLPVLAATATIRESSGVGIDKSTDVPEYHLFLLADAKNDAKADPEPGALVIPGESDTQGEDKKQCLNVCKKWGEDCIINPRTGARNCRRTCKEFGVECF